MKIYDQKITNWPSATWLSEMRDQELAADPTPARVYSGAKVEAAAPQALARGARWHASPLTPSDYEPAEAAV